MGGLQGAGWQLGAATSDKSVLGGASVKFRRDRITGRRGGVASGAELLGTAQKRDSRCEWVGLLIWRLGATGPSGLIVGFPFGLAVVYEI